jgi:Ca-activated chloride channel family protein
LSFDRPLALLALALLPAIVAGFVLVRRRRNHYAVRFTNLEVLRSITPRLSSRREAAVGGLLLAVLALLCVALARPHVNRVAPVENATVVLVVDTSRSMLAGDIAPSRLEAAKAAARTFLDRVPDRLRVGLVTFAGEPTVAAVPTHDRALLHDSVDAINPFQSGGGGTAIGDALALGRACARVVQRARRNGGSVERRRLRRDDPVPLRRTPVPRDPCARGGRGARQARRDPRLHRRARH